MVLCNVIQLSDEVNDLYVGLWEKEKKKRAKRGLEPKKEQKKKENPR